MLHLKIKSKQKKLHPIEKFNYAYKIAKNPYDFTVEKVNSSTIDDSNRSFTEKFILANDYVNCIAPLVNTSLSSYLHNLNLEYLLVDADEYSIAAISIPNIEFYMGNTKISKREIARKYALFMEKVFPDLEVIVSVVNDNSK